MLGEYGQTIENVLVIKNLHTTRNGGNEYYHGYKFSEYQEEGKNPLDIWDSIVTDCIGGSERYGHISVLQTPIPFNRKTMHHWGCLYLSEEEEHKFNYYTYRYHHTVFEKLKEMGRVIVETVITEFREGNKKFENKAIFGDISDLEFINYPKYLSTYFRGTMSPERLAESEKLREWDQKLVKERLEELALRRQKYEDYPRP
jgi:hypothetical protein